MIWNEAEIQRPYEYLLKNHLPEGFSFYEDYGAYPELEITVTNANEAATVVKDAFEKHGFVEDMVSVELNKDIDFEEVRMAFDLLLFNEEKTKECLRIASEALSPFQSPSIN